MRTASARCPLLLVIGFLLSHHSIAGAQDPATVGQWTGIMPWPDKAVHSAMLHTGKVLWYRGEGTNHQSWLWDPIANTLEGIPFNPNIFCSGLSTLPDGKVFVTGGRISGSNGPRHSYIFDPVAKTWTRGPDFRQGRYYPTNLQLGDGRTLIFSGYDESGNVNEEVESYTPGSATFEYLTGANRFMAYYPRMHLLPSGKIIHVGKEAESWTFEPATRVWSPLANSNFGSRSHGTSVLLPPGFDKVMILGDDGETNTVEVIDLSAPTPTWSYAPPMRYPRGDMSAVILPDATVLACGGVSGGSDYPVELYDPATNSWKLLAPNHSERKYHSSAVLLPDGRVLLAGADGNHTAEVFSPPYLFQGARPVIDTAPTSVQYGDSFVLTTAQAASITRVCFLRPAAATHAQDMQQRYIPLTHRVSAEGELTVTAPSDPDICPPGYYMIFIHGADKIPSVAKFINVGGTAGPEIPPPPTGGGSNQAPIVLAGDDQTITLPATANLLGRVTDDDLPAPPAIGTVWRQIGGPGTANIADSTALSTTVSFTAPGSYDLRLIASDGELTGSDVVTIQVNTGCGAASVIDAQVLTGNDDAEEKSSGSMSLTSSDLELVTDGTNVQTVGMRFTGIDVPQGARIQRAWLQFKVDEATSDATSLTIWGNDADSAAVFVATTRNLSLRPRTDASVRWTPVAWTPAGASGDHQKSPDLKDVIQEIVDRPNWKRRSLALLITGTGRRIAEAFEGDRLGAARLHIELDCSPPGNRPPVVDAGPEQTITLPDGARMQGAATDDGLPFGFVAFTWSQVPGTGAGEVDFDDRNNANTLVRFPASGEYELRLTADDGEFAISDVVKISVRQPGATDILERRVAAGNDDAEEKASGSMSLTSSDLELVYDGSNQVIGMRFTNIDIRRGSTISKAWIQFSSDEAQTEATSLTIYGEASDNAGTFTTASRNLSSRSATTRSVAWTPAAWTSGAVGDGQKTPDLAPVIQEIVARSGWTSGNSLVILVRGTGHRTADSFEGGPARAPLLHVEFGSTGDTHEHGTEPTVDLAGAIARLGPVFPNPGSGRRTIHFAMAREAQVGIDVFDVRGALVRTIARGPWRAGAHAETWDGCDRAGKRLAKGVYWLRFSADRHRETRKLVILD